MLDAGRSRRVRVAAISQREVDRRVALGEPVIVVFDDAPGLELFIGRRRATWRTRFSHLGRDRVMSCGPASALSAASAAELARQAHHEAAAGRDPRATLAFDTGLTLGELIDAWAAASAARTVGERAGLLRRHLAHLLRRPAGSVTEADLQTAIDTLRRDRRPTARNLQIVAGTLYRWAAKTKRVAHNPTVHLARTKPGRRSTFPSLRECRQIYRWAQSLPKRDRALVTLVLMTGCRTGEALKMQAGHVDRGEAIWRQPGALTKNGADHFVPLSAPVVSVLAPVLDGLSRTARPFAMRPERKTALMTQMNEMLGRGGDEVRFHDIRRALVSIAATAGGDVDALDRLLNHTASSTSSGVKATYQTSEMTAQRRRELERWALLLTVGDPDHPDPLNAPDVKAALAELDWREAA